MSGKFVLETLEELEEFYLLDDEESSKNIVLFQIDISSFGLLSYNIKGCRISFFKLSIDSLISNSYDDKEHLEKLNFCLLKVFCLPFPLLTVVCSDRNVWVIGEGTIVDLKPFIQEAVRISKSDENDESMDVDDIEEFNCVMFLQQLDFHHLQKYPFQNGDIFIGCNLTDCAVVYCHKNSKLNRWDVELVLATRDALTVPFMNFPLSFNDTKKHSSCNQAQDMEWQPVFVFINPDEPEYQLFQKLFGINCFSPNVLCLVGHPGGKMMWSLYDVDNKLHPSSDPQTLFDMKQSIVGIFFISEIESFRDCACLLVVGVLGQLTLISSKKHSSFNLEPGFHPKWTKTFHLQSSIRNCVVLKDCLLHSSNDGILWISNLAELFRTDKIPEESCSSSTSAELGAVDQLILADKRKGLILLKMKCGSLYVTQLKKEDKSAAITSSSLPSLMNDCLKQSNAMQQLLSKKVLQSRLFSTLSTFASLKFCSNILKEPVTFSISEVNLEPKKFLLTINLKCLEKLNFDPELCYTTATVFTYFENNNSLITKTVPYNVDQLTLCLELTDSVLQPPYVSIFPLFVEVGLIVQLPKEWKVIDCFKAVSSCLPFYLRVQTFMVHELNVLQSKSVCAPESLKFEIPRTIRMIKKLGLERPISNVIQVHSKQEYSFPKKFFLCLSASSVEEIMKNSHESNPCEFIKKLLLGRMHEDSGFNETHLTSKSSPMSLKVTKNNSYLVITLSADSFNSLVGLRIAVMDILLSHNQYKQVNNSSTYVNIPASICRKCEEISKSLIELCGKDVESDEFVCTITQLYQALRTDISAKLPLF